MAESTTNEKLLDLEHIAIFGFDGQIPYGLKIHPNKKHMLFPLGNKVSILNIETNKQEFLSGHTNTVSAVDISKTGAFIASGQKCQMGYRSIVIIWNWDLRKETCRHSLHKICVQSLCFTLNEDYLISLGGQDDGTIAVWNVIESAAICGAKAARETTGHATNLTALHKHENLFLSAGEYHLRLWQIDILNRRLMVEDVSVGKLRRIYTSMKVNPNDGFMYVGTMSGDIIKVQINSSEESAANLMKAPVLIGCYGRHNPKKTFGKDCDKYPNGVRDLEILHERKQLIIGAGDGTVELIEERIIKIKDYPSPTWPKLKTLKRKKVNGAVTTLKLLSNIVFIGTDTCEIYSLNIDTFDMQLQITCNVSTVYDIAFPNNFSFVFATASYQSIRTWSLKKKQELLRIIVPNFTAAAVLFSFDGKSIISAWNDGVIRAFTPLRGTLIYDIPNAHHKGCSTLAISKNSNLLVSGGCEGQIRIWKIEPKRQSLIAVLKEHKAPIASLDFNCFGTEMISASSDGTCIIWDITHLSRKHVLYGNTQFTCAQFYPTGVQILATGTDRHISYWEVLDASLVRNIEGSVQGSINCLSLNASGEIFASCGNDQIVKLWNYESGAPIATGVGHAASIITCKISPCGKYIVSGSADGVVFIWKIPEQYWPKDVSQLLSSSAAAKKKNLNDIKTEDVTDFKANSLNKELQISECLPVNSSRSNSSNNSRVNNK